MFARIALLCLIVLFAAVRSSAQQYDLRTYSLEQGMPSASVNAICEDHVGHLWIGTREGVTRTDGSHFMNLGRRDGLPHDDITAIHCSTTGPVWLGTANGALAVVEHGIPKVIANGNATRGSIRDIVEDPTGRVWVATTHDGVWQYENGSLRKDPTPGSPGPLIRALAMDAHGRVIAGGDRGAHVLDNGRWNTLTFAERNVPSVLSLHADEQGVLIGTTSGYLELDKDLRPLPPEQRYTGHFPITLPDRRVTSILRSRSGEIWIGTPSGVAHLTKRSGQPILRVISETNGLGHDLVLSIYQDSSGAIWFGTAFGGVSRFMSDAFVHFTERDGLRSRIVSAIHRTPDGLLWIATLGGGVAVWDGQKLSTYGRENGLHDQYILALGEDPEGYLIAGTAGNGTYRFNGKLFLHDSTLAPSDARVQVIGRDEYQNLWVGHDKGIQVTDAQGGSVHVQVPEGVLDLTLGSDTAWIASSTGLYFIKHGEWRIQRHNAVPTVTVNSIVRDVQANLWLGTDGHGLLRLNGTQLDSMTTEHNSMGSGHLLSSNAVVSVLLDAHQNIWAGTRRGIHELELDVMQEMILGMQHFGAEDGFIGIEAFPNAAMLDNDSTLWFGTLRGATRYDPRAVRTLHDEPRLLLTGMQLFFEDVDWSRWSQDVSPTGIPHGLALPFNQNHITFNFTGISLAFPERVRYRYILQGHDPEWSPITPSDRVIYSNIPPGEYTFKIMARNASGIWTEEPLTYSFSIIAPFWQRTWLQLLAIAFLAFLVFAFIRYRERRAKRIQLRLEGMVQDRTKELSKEKQRSENLLLNILPKSTAEELKNKGTAETRRYESSTVLFSDFAGFTSRSSQMDEHTLVADLDHFFRIFDRITDDYGVEKIKTIGDAYMCASGIPEPKPSHALDAVLTASSMMLAMMKSNAERVSRGLPEWGIRIGMHSGAIVAGVVGEKKFAYDIWGDTVNIASRMESNSLPGRINISGVTYSQVMDFVEVMPRGPIKIKGRGELHMYFLMRLKPEFSADPQGLVPNERLLRIREEMLSLMTT